LGRFYLADLAHLARTVPTATVQRRLDLASVAAAREAALPRPHWMALFVKALAFVAAGRPELRRLAHAWPIQRVHEHTKTVAAVAVCRPHDEQVPLLWARLSSPEKAGLCELDDLLKGLRDEPGDVVSQIRSVRRRSSWPHPVRRLAWWCDMYTSGHRRARRLGTLAVASAGQQGGSLVDAVYPATALLLVGEIDAAGTVDVRLKFDVRIMDASQAAGALHDLERALTCEILMELRYLQKLEVA
jgi:hypothetical protein